MKTFLQKTKTLTAFLALFTLLLMPGLGWGQVSLTTTGTAYTQAFNLLANSGTNNTWNDNSTIAGWYSNRIVYIGDDGSNNTGGLHSYGTTSSNERALGALSSGSANPVFGVRLVNNTGGTVPSFSVSYQGEQWRQTANAQILAFEYQVGATSLTTGTWTPVTALDFTAPKTGTAGALDGNAAGNFTAKNATITVNVTNGQEIWFRWTKTSSTSPGLAVDDFSVTANSGSVSAPTTQASNIAFGSIVSNGMTTSWTNGDGAKRVVIMNTSNSFTAPADGTDPTANTVYGGSGQQVVFNGSGNTVAVTGLSASTTYWYRVYEYNGSGATTKYLTTSATNNPNSQATTAACAVNPTITTTVAASAITPTAASSGGAGLSSGENCAISVKGVCWNTLTGPTTANSKTTDGAGTTDFTSSLTSLSAQTLYYVRAYATNSFGTAYGPEITFRTLSTELAAHPASFTATATSSSQINLAFSAASTITNADGYIILRRTGSNPTITNIIDGVAPTSLTMPSGTTFVADITSTSTTTYNNTGLPNPNTQYNYAIIAYNWDGVNPETYNYYTSGTIKTTNATTLCGSASIPYTQNFESATVPAIPACNTIENAGTGNNWKTINNPGSGFTSKTLEYEYNTSNAANAWYYTQGLNLTGGTSYRLTFNYGCASATFPERLKVKYGTVAAYASMTNSLYDNPSITNDVTPNTQIVDFTPATTGVYYIGFNAYSIANQFYLYVDDISVEVSPSCIPPTALTSSAITATTATISWTAAVPAPGNGYIYEVRTSGAAGSGATGLVTSGTTSAGIVTANVTGLTDNTLYSVYVQSDCGSSDFSIWTSAYTFTTSSVSAPVATSATAVGSTSFNANWGAVTGASGGYLLDVSTYSGFATTAPAALTEGFEIGMPTSGYSTGSFTLGSGDWYLVDGLKGTGSGNFNTGTASCQLKASTGKATSPALNNVGTVTFYAKSPSGATMTIKKIVN